MVPLFIVMLRTCQKQASFMLLHKLIFSIRWEDSRSISAFGPIIIAGDIYLSKFGPWSFIYTCGSFQSLLGLELLLESVRCHLDA
jgi:hypothetical protein